jgi:hypothetical protein
LMLGRAPYASGMEPRQRPACVEGGEVEVQCTGRPLPCGACPVLPQTHRFSSSPPLLGPPHGMSPAPLTCSCSCFVLTLTLMPHLLQVDGATCVC